jgi:hypothetical protein
VNVQLKAYEAKQLAYQLKSDLIPMIQKKVDTEQRVNKELFNNYNNNNKKIRILEE